ncbi:hypothetical protein M422DRAFT_275384 [Sphaerobolus stellatus SS14]|uniref:Unplaced genomic scaffold SPHSTscaffold_482, whole genome shotgun sequence n=1 Tax=Sphaerobolus stellatus (strain SS14) TaxID=990650 RepID=A0A0C9UFK7_SPHS4|nr:hypothetical protein M422DRAFT_275384 [Sphaerobolus stellatus SS14]
MIGEEMEQAIDDFINANCLTVKCRCQVADQYFGNNLVAGEAFCCDCCYPKPPPLCCDLCHSELFEFFKQNEVTASMGREGGVDEDMMSEDEVEETATCRRTWRAEAYKTRWPCGDPMCMGEMPILPDDILECIVDLSYVKLITKEEDICAQACWHDPWKFSKDIFEIVNRIIQPIPKLFTSIPRNLPARKSHVNGDSGASGISGSSCKTVQCAICGEHGHNRRTCPKQTPAGKENIPPGSVTTLKLNTPVLDAAPPCDSPQILPAPLVLAC